MYVLLAPEIGYSLVFTPITSAIQLVISEMLTYFAVHGWFVVLKLVVSNVSISRRL
jgi:glucose uptake protein GlcU